MNYYKENFPRKFLELLEHRYSTTDKGKRRGKFKNEYYDNFNEDLENIINQWCSDAQKDRAPTLEQLMNVCSLLDCDIDYFLTEQNDFQSNIRYNSDCLGLAYETIERVSNYDDKIKGLIDVLVFDNHNNHSDKNIKNADLFLDLLDSIHEYALNYSASSIKYKTAYGIEHEITGKKQIDNLLRNNSIRECGTILDTVCIEYAEAREYNFWLFMNDMIISMVSSYGKDEDMLRKKFNTPKQYVKSIPKYL